MVGPGKTAALRSAYGWLRSDLRGKATNRFRDLVTVPHPINVELDNAKRRFGMPVEVASPNPGCVSARPGPARPGSLRAVEAGAMARPSVVIETLPGRLKKN